MATQFDLGSFISGEALPDCSSSTPLFANAPSGVRTILLTLRSVTPTTALLTINGNGTASATNGIDYPVALTTFELRQMDVGKAKLMRAFATGTVTGWIEYWGRVD